MEFHSHYSNDFTNIAVPQSPNLFSYAQQIETTKIMDISPWDDLFEFGFTPHLPYNYQSNQLCFNGIDLDNLNFDDIDLPHLDEKFGTEQKPLKNKVLPQPLPNRFGEEGLMIHLKKEVKENNEEMIFPSSKNKKMSCVLVKEEVMENNRELILLPNTNSNNRSCKKRKSCNLEYDEIKKHFGVPITEAAKEMNVGLTLLKRRCRELNIKRWPHRKLKSLEFLIENVKEMGMSNEVAMLEQHRKMLEKLPDLELTEETKKLRQTCFKANYKKRWCLV